MSLTMPIRTRRAKFVPPAASPWMVPRPRLAARLDDARSFPVTLISAPAGSGKTTLLAEWVRSLDLRWGWLTVDESDGPIDALLTNLILAMQMAAPGLGESALSLLRLETEPNLDLLVAELEDGLLGLDTDLIVVLDDVHTISSLQAIEFFNKLLQYPPPRLHLVLSARRDPPIPLARLRSRGQLAELRAADLPFTEAETRALLQNAGLATDLASTLGQCNDGWAAGIHLGVLALRGRTPERASAQDVEDFVQAGVSELIVNDILAQQPEPLRRLLMVSSLVERFTGDLCETLLEVTGQALPVRSLLRELAGDGLLLFSLGGEPEWFRYHQIFRDVLQAELRQRVDAAERARLHARASAWFDQAGMVSEALTHALAADRVDDAVAIVERAAQTALARDQWPELAHWLERLPPAVVRARPELIIAHAAIHQSRGDYPALISALDRATVLLDAAQETAGDDQLAAQRADLDVLRLFIQRADLMAEQYIQVGERSIATGRARFISSFGVYELGFGLFYLGAYDELTARMHDIVTANRGLDDPFARQRELWARQLMAFVPVLRGEWPRSVVEMEEVLGLARSYEMHRFAAQVQYVQGWSRYERNEVDAAIDCFEQVLNERSSGIIVLVNSTLGLVRSLDAAGRSSEADTVLQRLSTRYEGDKPISYGRPLVAACRAERALLSGDVAGAMHALRSISEWRPGVDLITYEHPLATRIRVLIAAGRLGEADRDLQAVEQAAGGPPPVRSFQVRVAALRGLHAIASGDRDRAVAAFRSACELAAPGRYVRTILDLGLGTPVFQELLALLPPDELPLPPDTLQAYYRGPAAVLAPASSSGPQDTGRELTPFDLLTERERDVAEGLMRRLSYKEIAQELNISPLTVKSHATRLYSKLGVASRRQMIRLLES